MKKRRFNSFSLANPQGHGLRNPIKREEGGGQTERHDEWREKRRHAEAVQWLQTGTEDQSPGGRRLTGICCAGLFCRGERAHNSAANKLSLCGKFWEDSNSDRHHFFMEQGDIYQDIDPSEADNSAAEILTPNTDSGPLLEERGSGASHPGQGCTGRGESRRTKSSAKTQRDSFVARVCLSVSMLRVPPRRALCAWCVRPLGVTRVL